MEQTFLLEREAKVILDMLEGDLEVQSWDEPSIRIETDGEIAELHQEGHTIIFIRGASDRLVLTVPPDTEIRATQIGGDVSIEQVRRVELHHVEGDVRLEEIGRGVDIERIGEAILLSDVSGDLAAREATSLRARGSISGDGALNNVALIEIERVEGDLSIGRVETAVIGSVMGDMHVEDIADALSCGNIDGDCSIEKTTAAEITLGNVGGDLSARSVNKVHIGNIGGDCTLDGAQAGVEIGNIGGDALLKNIGERLQLGSVGGDARLTTLQGAIEASNIGGDLLLETGFPAGSSTRLHVGGDAVIKLPADADLSMRAVVGGDIVGAPTASSRKGNMINLVYGGGAAQIELHVGGDLALRGGNPHSSSAGGWGWQAEFEREMAEFGREMSRLGQELSREINDALQQAARGSEWSNEIGHRVEEHLRRAQRKIEEEARRAEERGRRAGERGRRDGERGPRVHVRLNDREWRFDPERVDQLTEKARKAAAEGISGAFEAVERALGNLRIPTPPQPPSPPAPPTAPVPPASPATPGGPVADAQPQTSAASPAPKAGNGSSQDLEQEREAILRMIAEGRISPEEGDMLLEGLGS